MKFKYLKNDMKNLVKIFDKNNVKLSFEDFENLYAALEKIIDDSVKIKVNNSINNLYASSAKEFDLKKRKIVSTGKGYRYSSLDYHPDDRVRKNVELIRKMFHYFPKGIFNIDSTFGVAYYGETTIIEGYYFSTTSGNFSILDNDIITDIFDVFNLSKNIQQFLFSIKKDTDLFDIEYIGMTFSGLIAKIGFVTPIYMLMQSDYTPYKEYKKFINVLDVLRDLPYDYGVGLQFVTNINYSDYIALEYVIAGKEESIQHLEAIRERKIIKSDTLEYTKNMLEIEEYDAVVFKFKWNNHEDFNMKLYLEKNNSKFNPFIW